MVLRILIVFAMVLSHAVTASALDKGTPHTFESGPSFQYFKYEEPSIMEEKGMMYGAFATYTYNPLNPEKINGLDQFFPNVKSNTRLELDFAVHYGQIDYSSNGTGSIDDVDDYIFETRGLLGYVLPLKNNKTITPFVGFGFRYWYDDIGGLVTTTNHIGYDRESHYFYLPIGVEFTCNEKDGWEFSSSIEFDIFLNGEQESHFEDVSPSLSTLTNDQDKGYGVRGSFKITKEGEKTDFFIEPYVHYWNIEESDPAIIACIGVTCISGFEPDNETWEYGARVGGKF